MYCVTRDTICGEVPSCWDHVFRRSLNGKSSRKLDSAPFSKDECLDPVNKLWENVKDDERFGRPQTSRTAENIEKVSAAVCKKRIQTIAESIGISSASCQWILTKDLTMCIRVCQHIVPRMLNYDQSANEIKSASQAELKDMAKNRF
ncbi:hypothetical protein TNCV_1227981 [Trichonephila clavipes]|nr:hypothetical protein TNCV_1227981 [Trichonephila clavipes]